MVRSDEVVLASRSTSCPALLTVVHPSELGPKGGFCSPTSKVLQYNHATAEANLFEAPRSRSCPRHRSRGFRATMREKFEWKCQGKNGKGEVGRFRVGNDDA